MYLTIPEIERFTAAISALTGPGSTLAGDVQNTTALTSPFSEPFRRAWFRLGHPMVSGIDDPETFFATFGFTRAHVVEQSLYAKQFQYANPKMLAVLAKYPRRTHPTAIERSFFFTVHKPVTSPL